MRRNPFHIVPAPSLRRPAASHSLRGVPDFPSASRRAIALPMFPLAAQRAPQTPSRAAEPGCSKNSGDCPPLQKTSAQPEPKKIPGSRFIHSPAFFLFTFIHTY